MLHLSFVVTFYLNNLPFRFSVKFKKDIYVNGRCIYRGGLLYLHPFECLERQRTEGMRIDSMANKSVVCVFGKLTLFISELRCKVFWLR